MVTFVREHTHIQKGREEKHTYTRTNAYKHTNIRVQATYTLSFFLSTIQQEDRENIVFVLVLNRRQRK